MIKRRRFKQSISLADRLTENVDQMRRELDALPPGPERDNMLRRIRQNETASQIEKWLGSPGLQPPTELAGLGRPTLKAPGSRSPDR
ncbi:hypothetical protein [Bradyrhizobium sp. NC92]|uniref:hypothetical protein n=1 Tax=Bradyrhizobium sp. (strain NC92) TaxID=55395 RepID=UPI0021AAC945|nr:hypothetical protein [Bradyrhizobium sp. NC92]UWU67597.1 hypothetical protein N2602_30805 [Bradyrhizobium sp. NC92]